MYALWISSAIWLAAAGAAQSDVFYEEEVVNSGMGSKKIGARKTVNQVYIKGQRQRVHSEIKATKKNLKALSKQGTPVDASTILQLDRSKVLEIDHEQAIYSTRRLPARTIPGMPGSMPSARFRTAAKPTAAAKKDKEITFRTRAMTDTSRIDGILCRRVAAELVARHYQPGTKKLRRENRYLYQAWVAIEFDGYEEIRRFNQRQAKKTSYPLVASGGLNQLADSVDDYDDLEGKLAELDGFPIQSELKVFTKAAGQKKKQLLRLQRKVTSLKHTPLPDSLFELSKGLRLVKP